MAPDGVTAPVQYGPQVTAIIIYLNRGQFLSKKRTAQALSELSGTPVSEGTVAATTRRAAGGLTGFLELVRGKIVQAPVVHFGETEFRVEGTLYWVHSALTGTCSLSTVHRRRGTNGMDHAGVLSGFSGVAVHDAGAPYDIYTRVKHALCNSHLLRELQAVADLSPAGESWCWATQVSDALLELTRLAEAALEAGQAGIDEDLAPLRPDCCARRCASVSARTRRVPRRPWATHHALARCILDRQDDYLRFTIDFRVPFDNNAAEREIRMVNSARSIRMRHNPLQAPDNSPRSDPTWPPRPNMESPSSMPSSNWHKVALGYPPSNDLTSRREVTEQLPARAPRCLPGSPSR